MRLNEIESNFYGNLVTLNKYYKLFDEVLVIDTSKSLQHKVLIHLRGFQSLILHTIKRAAWLVHKISF